jgi:hypothetical protein
MRAGAHFAALDAFVSLSETKASNVDGPSLIAPFFAEARA